MKPHRRRVHDQIRRFRRRAPDRLLRVARRAVEHIEAAHARAEAERRQLPDERRHCRAAQVRDLQLRRALVARARRKRAPRAAAADDDDLLAREREAVRGEARHETDDIGVVARNRPVRLELERVARAVARDRFVHAIKKRNDRDLVRHGDVQPRVAFALLFADERGKVLRRDIELLVRRVVAEGFEIRRVHRRRKRMGDGVPDDGKLFHACRMLYFLTRSVGVTWPREPSPPTEA